MSASPVIDPPAMPTMVSRLPKFGSRPKPQTHPAASAVNAAGSTRLTNGFYHHPGPTGGNGASPSTPKQNGFIRTPSSFSSRWKEDGGKGGNVVQTRSGVHQYYSQRPQGSPLMSQRDAKKTAFNGKGRVNGQPAMSPAASPQASPRTLPLSKSGSKLGSPGPPGGARQSPGVSRSKPRCSSLRQPQTVSGPRPGSGPGSRSGSPLNKKPPAGRSYSSDSLGSAPSSQLSENDRLRSRSLTQVRRQPSPTLSSSSSSLPRYIAAERGSPPEGGARGGGGVKPGSGRYGAPAILPPTALKKPLLPSLSPTSKPSGISYKLSRPSLMKQPRPLRAAPTEACGGVRRRDSIETPSTAENSPETSPESEEPSPELVSQGQVSIVGETLEDMSLSSTSSLDRNDTSQEYMDDFDNFGSGGVGLLLLSDKNDEDDSGLDQSCTRFDDDRVSVNGVTKTTRLCFLDDGADWTSRTLPGERVEHRTLSRRRRSSQPEYHDQGGSSLDLSPSDSCGSAGTYLWDEEGLEPLGGATNTTATTASIHTNNDTTHHIGSFDSDLNSIDLLNHLDSCDLADDDLMLDVDFPEDASLHSEVEGLSHMAQWRKRQLCWGTQDVHDNDDFHSLTSDPGNKRSEETDLILELRSVGLTPAAPGLGVDVEELAEDCSAVRSQLEYLQRLLLQEEDADDDTLTTDTLSPDTNDSSHSSTSQVEALLQEVQQLREELRSRDRTIAQLTVQLTVPTVTTRCCCQATAGRTDQCTQTNVRQRESVASQTPWKEHTSQVLHSPHPEPLTHQAPPPPPSQAPPSAEGLLHRVSREDAGKRPRSLLPSKLRLFSSHTSGPASSSPPPQRTSRQPDSRLKAPSSASFMSRLPKPKSQ
uniref:Coiled-coil serine-rich protein 2b n=1 Tax=Salarias fasciatus TaxID=181472 RepID=A0A672G486_SALFA